MQALIAEIAGMPTATRFARVVAVQGLVVEVAGVKGKVGVGSRMRLVGRDGRETLAEVVGFSENRALAMPFGPMDAVGMGARVIIEDGTAAVYPSDQWLGRVIDSLGRPVDDGGELPRGAEAYPLKRQPPPAHQRNRVGDKIELGVRAMNTFLSCCRGQRMGIFAGSGVGKSSLLSMLARYSGADVIVIGLVGERGREAREFIEDDLGPDGLARSVVVVATSDESALMRRQAAHMTLTVAEYFRDQGKDVLCLMDSVTRFAMAQREIGLSGGEPPTSKGYTPTVFAELPKLLERAGPGTGRGSITGLFTVLVEGDDHNEPVADAVRGILDGHIVLERTIAERGRFPAINILRSVSRTMPGCNTPEQNRLVRTARRYMSAYEDMAEMIRLGAYRRGSNEEVDTAIDLRQPLEDFLGQAKKEPSTLEQGYAELAAVLAPVMD
ncbi:flagellum-specific ATP synthase [Zavarzinia compransoris]|nr:flagellum-specific ATP synthase [Zavarzinia compransoris]